MREIKFRAWDKLRNEMIHNWDLSLRHSDIVDLMQFTGLKDRRDVEIYEGDIVKEYKEECFRVNSNGEELFNVSKELSTLWKLRPSNEIKEIFAISNLNNGCFESLYEETHDGIYLKDTNYIEVIGNIYENKDLLK